MTIRKREPDGLECRMHTAKLTERSVNGGSDRYSGKLLTHAAELMVEGKLPVPGVERCIPHGRPDETMHVKLASAEPWISNLADADPKVRMLSGSIDMARLSAINRITRRNGGGDATLALYWKLAAKAWAATIAINNLKAGETPEQTDPSRLMNLYRVSDGSDEGLMFAFGKELTHRPSYWFKKAWNYFRAKEDLKKRKYTIVIGDDQYYLNLKGTAAVLKHGELVAACHTTFLGPMRIPRDMSGYLTDAVRELGNREITFRNTLPERFRGNKGREDVNTPFGGNLEDQQTDGILPPGKIIEIKFAISEEEAKVLAPIIIDVTRKGHAEAGSGKMGMRGLNTFLGKPEANELLTVIAQAMGSLTEFGIPTLPVSSGYLTYWCDLKPKAINDGILVAMIKKMIEEKTPTNGPDYLRLLAQPAITMINVSDHQGMKIEDVRKMLIIASLGRSNGDANILDKTDFIVNVAENIKETVQDAIYEELRGTEITKADIEKLGLIRSICHLRRTLRDTEDLVWVIRNDATVLANELVTSTEKIGALENWLFDFAAEKSDKIFIALVKKIERAGQ